MVWGNIALVIPKVDYNPGYDEANNWKLKLVEKEEEAVDII